MTPVEIIARGVAKAKGENPDQSFGMQRYIGGDNGRSPLWQQYVQQADAIWSELQQAGYAKE